MGMHARELSEEQLRALVGLWDACGNVAFEVAIDRVSGGPATYTLFLMRDGLKAALASCTLSAEEEAAGGALTELAFAYLVASTAAVPGLVEEIRHLRRVGRRR